MFIFGSLMLFLCLLPSWIMRLSKKSFDKDKIGAYNIVTAFLFICCLGITLWLGVGFWTTILTISFVLWAAGVYAKQVIRKYGKEKALRRD